MASIRYFIFRSDRTRGSHQFRCRNHLFAKFPNLRAGSALSTAVDIIDITTRIWIPTSLNWFETRRLVNPACSLLADYFPRLNRTHLSRFNNAIHEQEPARGLRALTKSSKSKENVLIAKRPAGGRSHDTESENMKRRNRFQGKFLSVSPFQDLNAC